MTLKYQQSAGRWVAYKSLFEGSRDDVILEAQVMQLLGNHPSFPAVYGVVIQADHLALVSEFLGDELTSRSLSLTDALQGQRPLELSGGEWNDIARDIVDGVWYMHRCNLLHHDLKTDNILLVDGVTRWEARIIDFGQCKQSNEQLVVPLDENITPHEEMMAARLHWTTFSDIYGIGKLLRLIGQHGNVPSLEEGGLSLKKSANLSKEPSDDNKYPQMEIVRFQLRNKSRKMWNKNLNLKELNSCKKGFLLMLLNSATASLTGIQVPNN